MKHNTFIRQTGSFNLTNHVQPETHTGVTNIQLEAHPTIPTKQMSTGCQMFGSWCLVTVRFHHTISWFAGQYIMLGT